MSQSVLRVRGIFVKIYYEVKIFHRKFLGFSDYLFSNCR